MSRHLPPLAYLRAFEATARLGSVTRAADELGRTHGAISKQLQLLQEQIGLPVFEKVGTGLRLNEDGVAFHATVSRAFDLLEEQFHDMTIGRDQTSVHIACSATFAMVWLVPRLAEFYRLHPSCKVQLTMSNSLSHLDANRRREEVDVTLSWDRLSKPVMERQAMPLGSVSFCLVAAPAYPVRNEGRRLIFPARITHDRIAQEWLHWQEISQCEIISQSELHFPHTHLCVSAAVAGMGVALVEKRLAAAELQSGKLIRLSPFHTVENGFLAMINPNRRPSPALTEFLEWLRQAFAQEAAEQHE